MGATGTTTIDFNEEWRCGFGLPGAANTAPTDGVWFLLTTAGKNGVANQILAAPTLAKMGWMAIGTGTPTATLLGAEAAFKGCTRQQ